MKCIYNTYGGDKNKDIVFVSKEGALKSFRQLAQIGTITKTTSIKRGFWSHLEYEIELSEGWDYLVFTAAHQPKSHLYYFEFSKKESFLKKFIGMIETETKVEVNFLEASNFWGEALNEAMLASQARSKGEKQRVSDRQAYLEKEAITVQDLKLYKYFFWVKGGVVSPLYCVNLSFNNKDFTTPPDKDFFYCALPSTKYREAYAEYEKHKGSPTEQKDCVQP